jgi:hypothetical protein
MNVSLVAVAQLILTLTVLISTIASTQTSRPTNSKPQGENQMGGASTGGTYAAVRDEKNRPITAGGFVDDAPVVFEDITQKSGLAAFQHVSSTALPFSIESEFLLAIQLNEAMFRASMRLP